MSVLSPNMNLVLSTVNVDSGLNWEQNLNSSLTILDGHNHAAGSGVQIQPSGLNINSALPFNNQQATNVQAVVFAAQTSVATLGSIYTIGADLYYNDANGNVIPITSGGAVNATSSGISSGPATASFVASVLVVNAASNTPANIQGASLLLGNNVAASKFLTLAPPAAMGSNYTVTLPGLPASTLPVIMDSSGNLGTSQIITAQIASSAITASVIANNTITATQIANNTITATQIANNTITRDQEAAVGQVVSASCGTFITNSTSPVLVSNFSLTITTHGRPVIIMFIPDGTTQFGGVAGSLGSFSVYRNGGRLCTAGTTTNTFVPPGALNYIDVSPGVATSTYELKAFSDGGNTTQIFQTKMVIYEL